MLDIQNILEELGYNLKDDGQYWRTNAVYRGGDNPNALRIRKESGYFCDFVTHERGSFSDLVNLTLKIGDNLELEKWLGDHGYDQEVTPRQFKSAAKVQTLKTVSKSFLDELKPEYNYWTKRGISKKTLDLYEGGLCRSGRFNMYYVFPVFNDQNDIIGLVGRDFYNGEKRAKWKSYLQKQYWVYPWRVHQEDIIASRKIILVESIGDMLSFSEAGIFNTLCLFGTFLTTAVLNQLIRVAPEKIFVCLNNDSDNNNIGQLAAEKIRNKLIKYFGRNSLKCVFPETNDFNDLLKMRGVESIQYFNEKLNEL